MTDFLHEALYNDLYHGNCQLYLDALKRISDGLYILGCRFAQMIRAAKLMRLWAYQVSACYRSDLATDVTYSHGLRFVDHKHGDEYSSCPGIVRRHIVRQAIAHGQDSGNLDRLDGRQQKSPGPDS